MTLLEGLIGIIAILLLVGVIILARLAGRMGASATEVGVAARRIGELTPSARELMERGQVAMDGVRSVSHSVAGIAEDVRSVTGHASTVTSRVAQGLEYDVIGRYHAVLAGARAGIEVLRRLRGGNGAGVAAEEFDTRTEEFDHTRI